MSTVTVSTATTSTSSRLIEDNKIGTDTFGNSDNAESTTTSAIRRAADHLIDFVLGRIDSAGETIAAFAITLDLHAPFWHLILERCCIFQVDWIPAELDKGLAILVDVGSCHVGRPIANGAVFSAPNTSLLASSTRRVDVVTD